MANEDLETALDRIEQALALLETAAEQRVQAAAHESAAAGAAVEELGELRNRHRKLKDTVAQELRQLDLLLANLPNPRG